MKRAAILIVMSILAMGLTLTACTAETEGEADVVAMPPSPTQQVADNAGLDGGAAHDDRATPSGEEQGPTPTTKSTPTVLPIEESPPTSTATEVPTETPEAEGDKCLACHADKEKLVETATVEEKALSESSGVG